MLTNILILSKPKDSMAKQQEGSQDQGFDPSRMYVWLKGLEGKVNNLLRQVNVIKNDSSKKTMSLKQEIKSLSEDVLDVKRQQAQITQKVDLLIKELKRTAGIEEVATLKKYIDLWNPLNFVTQRDVERIVERKVDSLMQDQTNNTKNK